MTIIYVLTMYETSDLFLDSLMISAISVLSARLFLTINNNIIILSQIYNRHINTQYRRMIDLVRFFDEPATNRQRQYEAVRALVKDNMLIEEIAKKFGYKSATIHALVRDAKSGKLKLFPEVKKGPKARRTSEENRNKIIQLRKENLSSSDIHKRLSESGVTISSRTIERVLSDAGFGKLRRRTYKEMGMTKKNKIIPEKAEHLDFSQLEPFNIDCAVAGIFFFLPYVIESGVLDVVTQCKLPESSAIGATGACLSMLFLKLIGNERLSHMDSYDREPGFGLFAGLNVLPKSTYMNTYSCRTSSDMLLRFQQEVIDKFCAVYPQFYRSKFINLDFHSIPHFGDESEMEKVWCGARGKAMKGAHTIFAQDGQSNVILYTRADILRKEESEEIKRFVSYWKTIRGCLEETLVFDCKFTKYKVLDELTEDGVKFITLRKRSQKLIEQALEIPKEKWQKIRLPISKRKHCNLLVYESKVTLKDCQNEFRQIIVKDHGRAKPTFIITNNMELRLAVLVEVYAKRWHIETKLSELVSFFNLNALSSPLMIRIHFDILWTVIADTLYRRFGQDLRRFEKYLAPTIFRKFINVPGRVVYDGNKFMIKIRKRSYTPILMGIEKLNKPFTVPWLDNYTIEIVWTA